VGFVPCFVDDYDNGSYWDFMSGNSIEDCGFTFNVNAWLDIAGVSDREAVVKAILDGSDVLSDDFAKVALKSFVDTDNGVASSGVKVYVTKLPDRETLAQMLLGIVGGVETKYADALLADDVVDKLYANLYKNYNGYKD